MTKRTCSISMEKKKRVERRESWWKGSKPKQRKDIRVLWSSQMIKTRRKNKRSGRDKISDKMTEAVRGRCLCLKAMTQRRSEDKG